MAYMPSTSGMGPLSMGSRLNPNDDRVSRGKGGDYIISTEGGAGRHFGTEQEAAQYLDSVNTDAFQRTDQERSLQNLQQNQLAQAKTFRQNLPFMQQQNAEMIRAGGNQQLSGLINQSRQVATNRGLGYGGMQAGKEASLRGQIGNKVASGIIGSNQALSQEANNQDAAAVGTAVGIQQSAQQAQNLAYQQAMAQMAGQNAMNAGLLGTAINAYALYQGQKAGSAGSKT